MTQTLPTPVPAPPAPNPSVWSVLRDPEGWLAAQPPLRRRTMAVNAKLLGTPVNVPLAAVDVPEAELVAAVDRWRQHAAR